MKSWIPAFSLTSSILLFLSPGYAQEKADKGDAPPKVPVAADGVPKASSAFFTKMRMEYAKRKDFTGNWQTDAEREKIMATLKERDFEKVFDLSGKWLARCPVDAEMHLIRANIARHLEDMKACIEHMHFAYGLMESITASGTGETPASAYKVISVAEEYTVLRELGAKVTQQRLIADGPCDQMTCKLPSGKNVTIYFNVAISMEAASRGLMGN